MGAEFGSRTGRWLLVGALVSGLALRLWVAWQPVSTLIEKNLPDDAFYYFMLARNALRTGSVSLDGVNVTNGFHPLWWLALMSIMGGTAPPGDLQVHLGLSLAALLDGVAIFVIARLAAELTGREERGALAAVLYAANPAVILQITNGLETALGMATLTLFWFALWRWSKAPHSLRRVAAVGVLGGLMFLARSDSVFFLVLALAGMLLFNGIRRGWPKAALAGGLAGLMAVPWFLWSRLVVGSWLQDSALAVPLAIRARFEAGQGASESAVLRESVRQLTYPQLWLRGDPTGLPLVIGVGLWLLVLGGLIWRWRLAGQAAGRRGEMAVLLPLLGAGVALTFFHAGLRWYPRPWYFVPTAAAFAVCAAMVTSAARPRLLFTLTSGVLAYYAVAGYLFWQVGLYPWQREMLAASTWMARNLPAESRAASFNAGIYAYYSGRRVVNLDGVVNHAAVEAIRAKAVIPYLQRERIGYLVDYDSAIRREYEPFMGQGYPEALAEIAVLGGQVDRPLGLLRAYRVRNSP